MKKLYLLCILIFLSICTFAQYVVQDNYQPVYGVKISKSSANLKINQGIQLYAEVIPEDATNKNIIWDSDDTNIATVDNDGFVRAVGNGIAFITAYSEENIGFNAICVVFVDSEVSVSGVELNEHNLLLKAGKTTQLIATVYPSNATNKNVSWTSDNDLVAKVDKDGFVTTKYAGKANITVRTQDGGYADTCEIIVSDKIISVESVELDKHKMTLNAGETKKLNATVLPSDATDKSVWWKTGDKSVATVSNGKVKGIKAGKTIITVVTNDESWTDICEVIVKDKEIRVEGVKLDTNKLTLYKNDLYKLNATVLPENATDKSVKWNSDDEDIIKVDEEGNIEAVGLGKTNVTVVTNDGDYSDTCEITVEARPYVEVTGVKLNKTSVTIYEGDTYRLKETVYPTNATNKNVIWSTKNKYYATVSSTGLIKGIKAGTTYIYVKTKEGGYTTKCKVVVKENIIKVDRVELNQYEYKLVKGKSYQLRATVYPSNATNKKVTWKSSNTNVATVDSKGYVKAKNPGTATITVTTEEGGKKDTCKIIVEDNIVYVTDVSISRSSISIYKGYSYSLYATVYPSNATNKNVIWYSSNTSVATVSSSGYVRGKKKGTATITVKTKDGGYTAKCRVTVK